MFSRIFAFTEFQLHSGIKTFEASFHKRIVPAKTDHVQADQHTDIKERKGEAPTPKEEKPKFVNGTPDGKLNHQVVKAKPQAEPKAEDLSTKTTLTVAEAKQLNEQVKAKREKDNQVTERWGKGENEVFLEKKVKEGSHTEKVQAGLWIMGDDYGMKLGNHKKHGMAGVDGMKGKDTKAAVEAWRKDYNASHKDQLKNEAQAEKKIIELANNKVDTENKAYPGGKNAFLKQTLASGEGHKPMQAGLTVLGYGDLGDTGVKGIDGKWGPKTGLGVGKFVNDYNAGKFNHLEGKPSDWRPTPPLSQPQDAEKKIVELGQKKIGLNEKEVKQEKPHHIMASHPHVKNHPIKPTPPPSNAVANGGNSNDSAAAKPQNGDPLQPADPFAGYEASLTQACSDFSSPGACLSEGFSQMAPFI